MLVHFIVCSVNIQTVSQHQTTPFIQFTNTHTHFQKLSQQFTNFLSFQKWRKEFGTIDISDPKVNLVSKWGVYYILPHTDRFGRPIVICTQNHTITFALIITNTNTSTITFTLISKLNKNEISKWYSFFCVVKSIFEDTIPQKETWMEQSSCLSTNLNISFHCIYIFSFRKFKTNFKQTTQTTIQIRDTSFYWKKKRDFIENENDFLINNMNWLIVCLFV